MSQRYLLSHIQAGRVNILPLTYRQEVSAERWYLCTRRHMQEYHNFHCHIYKHLKSQIHYFDLYCDFASLIYIVTLRGNGSVSTA
jgi:hypothetical protein